MSTYTEIYNNLYSLKSDINKIVYLNSESTARAGLEFLKENDAFIDNTKGANALVAYIGTLSHDESIKAQFACISSIFNNDLVKIANVLKPELDSWIKGIYPKSDINALALDAVASFMTIEGNPNSYMEMVIFLKELKRLESMEIKSENCGIILASLAIMAERPLTDFD